MVKTNRPTKKFPLRDSWYCTSRQTYVVFLFAIIIIAVQEKEKRDKQHWGGKNRHDE